MKKLLLRVSLVLVSILIGLSVAELVLEKQPRKFQPIVSTYDYSQFNINYGIEPKPNLDYKEAFGVRVRTNSVATFGPEIKPDVPVIMQLGDSFTDGPGIDYTKNYPYLIQQKASQDKKQEFQTVILGMGGSSPVQQQIIFQKKLPTIQPKLVIYELYGNDPRDDYSFYYSNYMAKMRVYNKFPHWFLKTAIGDRIYTLFSDSLTRKYEKKYNETTDVVEKDPKFIWETFTRPSLEAIREEAKKRNSSFLFFNLPVGWEFDNEYATKSAAPRLPMETYAKEWANQNKIPFVDMYDPFLASNSAKLNELYLDGEHGYHLTEHGAQIVTDQLWTAIKKYNLL